MKQDVFNYADRILREGSDLLTKELLEEIEDKLLKVKKETESDLETVNKIIERVRLSKQGVEFANSPHMRKFIKPT